MIDKLLEEYYIAYENIEKRIKELSKDINSNYKRIVILYDELNDINFVIREMKNSLSK